MTYLLSLFLLLKYVLVGTWSVTRVSRLLVGWVGVSYSAYMNTA